MIVMMLMIRYVHCTLGYNEDYDEDNDDHRMMVLRPIFGQKNSSQPRGGLVALLVFDYCAAYKRKVQNCSFFPFLKILKIYTFMTRKPKPLLF